MPKTDPHDSGIEVARRRSEEAGEAARSPTKIGHGEVRFGTASWTDPTMTAPGVFYPKGADSAEERLRFYASQFSMVEVDSTYYALPNKRTAEAWVERTPKDFVFDIKAHALMTGQPTEIVRLPKAIREELKNESISVIALCPSTIDTPANRADMPKADHATWVKPEAIAELIVAQCSLSDPVDSGALIPVYGRA